MHRLSHATALILPLSLCFGAASTPARPSAHDVVDRLPAEVPRAQLRPTPTLIDAGPGVSAANDGPCTMPVRPRLAKRSDTKRISLDLQDAEVQHVVRLIAEVSGLNIVVGDEVKGKVTMKLRNVPWDEALRVILKTKQLGIRWESKNIIRVAPQAVLDEEGRRELDLADDCVKRGPLKTKLLPVNYAKASEMLPVIKMMLTERGTAAVDERTNTIIIKDVACSPALR